MSPRIFLLVWALLVATGCDLGSPIRAGGGTEGVGLSGTLLLEDGSPAVGAKVLAFAATGDTVGGLARRSVVAATVSHPLPLDSAITDSNGTFRLARLSPGTYNLAASLPGEPGRGWFRKEVVYSGGRMKLPQDTLRMNGEAYLQVWEGEVPVAGATCFVPGSPYHSLTDETGVCLLGLPPGDYHIGVAAPGRDLAWSPETPILAGILSNCGSVYFGAPAAAKISRD